MGTLLSSISDDRCPEGMRGTTIEWVSARVLRDVFQCPYPCYDRRDLVEFGVLRGGPRNSDRLLRWDPDHREGVWNVPKETELPG